RNLDVLHPLISEVLRQKPLDHWIEALGAEDVPCGPINTIPRVFADEQVKHRQMVRTIPHPLTEDLPQDVSPMRFVNAPLSFDRRPTLLGEHTADVLAELAEAVETTNERGQ